MNLGKDLQLIGVFVEYNLFKVFLNSIQQE